MAEEEEWDDPPTDDESGPWKDPLTRAAMQVAMGVIIFVVFGTLIFNDPIQRSAIEGLLFGVAYAAIYAIFQYVRG